ncbi:sensor histidine kinase [Halobacteriovorax sp. ZH4_bin.1]|uniref:sensor histidine kinase n=3 Tax=Halobacteriovorax TaxID=1652133 RepID=UPI003717F99E
MTELKISRLIMNLLMDSLDKLKVDRKEFEQLLEKYSDKEFAKYLPMKAMNEFFDLLLQYVPEEKIVKVIGKDGIYSDRIALFKNLAFSFISHNTLYKIQSSFVIPYFYKGIKLSIKKEGKYLRLTQYTDSEGLIHPVLLKIYIDVYQNFPVIIGRRPANLISSSIQGNTLEVVVEPSKSSFFYMIMYYFKTRKAYFDARSSYLNLINELREESDRKNEELIRLNHLLDQSLKEKSILVRTIGHDINNSIYVSKLSCERIIKISNDDKIKDIAEKVKKHIEVIESISKSSLEGEMSDDIFYNAYTYENASVLLDELEDAYLEQLNRKKIRVSIEIELDDESLHVNKSVFLYNILANYFNNAIKYSEINGQITLKCEEDGEFLKFSIIDEGKGMDTSTIQQMLGTIGEKGHGQGMNIARSLLNKMFGEVTIESVIGKGTAVHCLIPRDLIHSTQDTVTESL